MMASLTATLLAWVPTYGPWLLALATFASCLALPIPASMLMLAAGGFVAAGDLSAPMSVAGALGGAVAGDQLGYALARRGGAGLLARLGSRAALIGRASAMLATHGAVAVFLSRWLISALGPYVNLAAGASRTPWATFALWGALGEAVWVGLYVGLGYAFTGNLEAASALALKLLGFLAAGAVALGLGWWLFRAAP